MKIFFDGGCRGVEGRMALAVMVRGEATIVEDAGCGTSGEAEWRALLLALETARDLGLADVVVVGDSADVLAKASGRLPAREHEAAHYARLRDLAPPRLRFRHVGRGQNLAGIALARRFA